MIQKTQVNFGSPFEAVVLSKKKKNEKLLEKIDSAPLSSIAIKIYTLFLYLL